MISYTGAEAQRLILAGDAPASMHVDGDLDLSGTTVTRLPEGLRVGGSCDLSGTAITSLPEDFCVGGSLYLGETATVAALLRVAPIALRLSKDALNAALDASSIEAVVAIEDRNQVLCARTPDFHEAMAAFRERRSPQWSGR